VGDDKAKQAATYARYLIPLALTNPQREEYIACRTHLANEDAVKRLKEQLGQAFQWSVEILRKDARQRTFPEAFDDGLRYVRGEPTRPFDRAFVKALSHNLENMPQIFQGAFKALPQNLQNLPPQQQQQQLGAMQVRILQGLRGNNGNWDALINETFDEALESIRADYQAQLENAFNEAKSGQRAARTEAGDTKKSDADEQRQVIARLLLAMVEPLTEDEAGGQEGAKTAPEQTQAFQRFLVVVGLQNGIRAINENAQTLARISYELGIEMDRERGDFAAAQQEFLALVQDEASRYGALRTLLEHKRNQVNKQQELVQQRTREIQKLQDEIAAARQATASQREELKKMSQGLFELRLQLRDATEKNQELEKTIRGLEEGR
jgi:hypothetical protein